MTDRFEKFNTEYMSEWALWGNKHLAAYLYSLPEAITRSETLSYILWNYEIGSSVGRYFVYTLKKYYQAVVR